MRILIADDSDMVRRGIAVLLTAVREWTVCGQAKNGEEALQKAHEMQPDLVLLDVSLPDINGLEICRRLRLDLPYLKILVISYNEQSQLLAGTIAAGADGCLDKSLLGTHLLEAVRKMTSCS